MHGKVYIHGQVCDPADARISIFDRGFLYGDSVFETLRVYHGVPFAFGEHLTRLVASGQRVGLQIPWDADHLRGVVTQTLTATGLHDLYLRIIVTRGSGPMNLDPTTARDPQLIVMALPLPPLPEAMYSQGRSGCLVYQGQRSVDPQAKTGNYLNSVLAARTAGSQGADEAILVDGEGRVTEASAANVFVRLQGIWVTPPLNGEILSGITRKTLLRLCRQEGLGIEERVLRPAELLQAQEIFLCASVREIVPLVRLDGKPVGPGGVGAATQVLRALYAAEVERVCGVKN